MDRKEFREVIEDLTSGDAAEFETLIAEGKQYVEEFKEHDPVFADKVSAVVSSLSDLVEYARSRKA